MASSVYKNSCHGFCCTSDTEKSSSLTIFWCYASPLGEFLLSLGRLSFTLLPRDFLGSTKRVDGELHVDIKL